MHENVTQMTMILPSFHNKILVTYVYKDIFYLIDLEFVSHTVDSYCWK